MDAITEPHSLGVAEAAYSRLRSDILGGELLPGMKLKLDALRERYDVSVNTLRETLSRLAADGLVEAEGQRGFTVIPATLVVMAVGIRPNSALAKEAGIAVNRGIVVDAGMRSNDPDIYALGECAEVNGQVYGLVAPLYEMARVTASQLAGNEAARLGAREFATRHAVVNACALVVFALVDARRARRNGACHCHR